MKYQLTTPTNKITGIGPTYRQLLANLGINTVEDLIFHIPFRYEDRSQVKKIAELIPNIEASISAEIVSITNLFTRRGFRLTKAKIKDETGSMDVIWFNQHYLIKTLKKGMNVRFFGKINVDDQKLILSNPAWDILNGVDENQDYLFLPIYYSTEGLSGKWLRKKILEVIDETEIPEPFDAAFRKKHELLPLQTSIQTIHKPKSLQEAEISRNSLSFHELFWLHLRGLKIRADWESKSNSHKISLDPTRKDEYLSKVPFGLTEAQIRSIDEILDDLTKETPMNRLLQGDVGSGKTLVAEIAIFASLESGFNAIFMAPTQILAKQHFEKIAPKLEELGFTTHLLTSDSKKLPDADTKNNSPHLVISTHAILHNLEKFSNIGLIVVDEQHKFGVAQRSKVIEHYTDNKIVPNLLTMSATPIPRSLALTLYGDLDLSLIDEMPPGRKKVITKVIEPSERKSAYAWIQTEINKNDNQVFIVCPFIEESMVEGLKDVKSAEKEFINIKKIFPKVKVGLLHGKTEHKQETIESFREGKVKILVATPVIEVGVDIPAANIIAIENPERFGLASLHQLRGRVGRGGKQAYCLLFTDSNAVNVRRIRNLETIHDGNKLAEIDLKLRGPGNIYGIDQHGFLDLRIADISNIELVKLTRTAAIEIYQNINDYPIILDRLNSQQYIDDQ